MKIIDTILVLLIILILYLLKRVKFYSDCCKNRFDYQLQNNLMLDAVGYGACTVDNNGHLLSINESALENKGAIVVFKDITTEVSMLQELNQRNIELDKLATTDGLSGLYNRRYFDDNLQIECDRALRGGTSFTLGICDIDSFKLYNDNYGHIKGDEVIHSVSNILKYTFNRQTDIVVSELLNIADSALYKSKENGKI
ncbi:MAG: GGDEF domain-containing protein [Sulfurimonas sp.]